MKNVELIDSILSTFFDDQTMSVHLKEKVNIIRKKGSPGNWIIEKMDICPNKSYLMNILNTLYKEVQEKDCNFLEIDRPNSKVFQIGPFRTVVVLPPVSNSIEITVVKPTKNLNLDDYHLDPVVYDLLKSQAKGILISGAPGEGKTTFAQALIQLYVNDNKIVKTLESPRDLIVGDDVTQYGFSHASHSELRDILLLSRPDYTIYDEVRNSEDFILYKDLRLTGIGLIGVTHATKPIDSIHRLIGNVEMGAISQIVDTVIYIKSGKIEKILRLKQVVKVPHGMESADLARPVIQLFDFFTQQTEYEIYSYGEQTVVMPLDSVTTTESGNTNIQKYALKYLNDYFRPIYNFAYKIELEGSNGIKLFVPDSFKGQIIGKQGSKIMELEKKLGISISVKDILDYAGNVNVDIVQNTRKFGGKEVLVLQLPNNYVNTKASFLIGDEMLRLSIDQNAQIEIKKHKLIKKIKSEGIRFFSFD